RFYVALYARGGAPKMPGLEDTYHWALVVGPKTERPDDQGKRYHAREKIGATGTSEWMYEERDISMVPSNMQLVRVLVAKIEDVGRFESILQGIPIRGQIAGWNCVEWVREALETLARDGRALGTGVVDWKTVRDACMDYVRKKKDQHRFDGHGNFDAAKAATYDLIEGKEIQV
ncbi:hypothetical protein DL95DRAFT_476114, partial [Leptodontidium sp. 2 PMI_412]